MMRSLLILWFVFNVVCAKPNPYEICTLQDSSRIWLNVVDTLDDISYCRIIGGSPGVVYGVGFCPCVSKTNHDLEYCLPYIESSQDSSYPCSPKMLEIYEQQKQEKEAMCKQFKQDWIAKKYPCAFDSDKEAVSNCRQELYKKYCQ